MTELTEQQATDLFYEWLNCHTGCEIVYGYYADSPQKIWEWFQKGTSCAVPIPDGVYSALQGFCEYPLDGAMTGPEAANKIKYSISMNEVK